MTSDRDLKKLVRARSRNTGESYVVARRRLLERLPGGKMESATLHAVDKPDLGFTVWVPESWTEYPPQPSNSPYEVARFRYRDEGRHICLVFRLPGRPGLTPLSFADETRRTLAAKQFEHFSTEELTLDGRPSVRMNYDSTRFDFGPWFCWRILLRCPRRWVQLGLGTSRPRSMQLRMTRWLRGFIFTRTADMPFRLPTSKFARHLGHRPDAEQAGRTSPRRGKLARPINGAEAVHGVDLAADVPHIVHVERHAALPPNARPEALISGRARARDPRWRGPSWSSRDRRRPGSPRRSVAPVCHDGPLERGISWMCCAADSRVTVRALP